MGNKLLPYIHAPKQVASFEFTNFPYWKFSTFLSRNKFALQKPNDSACLVMGIFYLKGTTYKIFVRDLSVDDLLHSTKKLRVELKVYRKDNKFSAKYDVTQHLQEILKQFIEWDKMTNPTVPVQPEESPKQDVSQNETLGNPEE